LFGGLSPKPLIDDGLPERNARVELEGRRCVGAGSRWSSGPVPINLMDAIKVWRFGVASAQIMWPPARGRSLWSVTVWPGAWR